MVAKRVVAGEGEIPPRIGDAQAFNVRDALNDTKFLDYLVRRNLDAQKLEKEKIKQEKESFDKIRLVQEDLRDMYQGQIKEEFGVKLEEKDLAAIDSHLLDLAVRSPEELNKLRAKIDKFKTLPAEIDQLEGSLKKYKGVQELENELKTANIDLENLEIASKHSGIVGTPKYYLNNLRLSLLGVYYRVKSVLPHSFEEATDQGSDRSRFYEEEEKNNREKVAVKVVKEKFGSPGAYKIESIYIKTKKRIEALGANDGEINLVKSLTENRDRAKSEFLNIRRELLGGIGEIKAIKVAIQNKVKAKIFDTDKIRNINNLNRVDEVVSGIDDYREIGQKTETGVNPFEGSNLENIVRLLNSQAEIILNREVANAVSGIRLSDDNGQFTAFTEALEQFTDMEKLGAKKSEEVRASVIQALRSSMNSLGSSDDDRKKKILIAGLIDQLKPENARSTVQGNISGESVINN